MPYVALAGLRVLRAMPGPVWIVPTLVFAVALGVALRAAAWFTGLLEDLGDNWSFSPGLLSFIGALGANIPNYAASLAAFSEGQGSIGLGIIVGSNLYNLTIILGLVTFTSSGGRGLSLAMLARRDVRHVTWIVAAMGITTWITVIVLTAGTSWQTPLLPLPRDAVPAAAQVVNLLTAGLFLGLVFHALQRLSHRASPPSSPGATASSKPQPSSPSAVVWVLVRCFLALAIALAGVIVMVQAGQAAGTDLHLPPAVLSLVVLAVATSLPNTVVAVQLARTERASASVEEILSSNGINLALGIALPVLLWSDQVADPSLLRFDLPLLGLMGLFVVALVHSRRIPRMVGAGFLGAYALWVAAHILL